jgi:cytochrome c oxidase cbb3-type subunit 2
MRLLKMKTSIKPQLLIVLIVLLLSAFATGNWERAYSENDVGKRLFNANCAVCHGEKGDSIGQVIFNQRAELDGKIIRTYSRDFTLGVFKFRTTATGCLPVDSDIVRILSTGIPKSYMPSFNDLSMDKKMAIINYVKSFSPRWNDEEPCKTIAMNRPSWLGTPEAINKGEKIYKDMKCFECHGDKGKGDGAKSDKLKDDWGHQIYPFNFTTGDLKRGSAPEDIYITFTTGIDGTGMPSYADSLDEESRWSLVSYTMTLMKK